MRYILVVRRPYAYLIMRGFAEGMSVVFFRLDIALLHFKYAKCLYVLLTHVKTLSRLHFPGVINVPIDVSAHEQ